jgi:hypothetical protein
VEPRQAPYFSQLGEPQWGHPEPLLLLSPDSEGGSGNPGLLPSRDREVLFPQSLKSILEHFLCVLGSSSSLPLLPSLGLGCKILGAWPRPCPPLPHSPGKRRLKDKNRAAYELIRRQRLQSLGVLPPAPPRSPSGHSLDLPAQGLLQHRVCQQCSGQRPDACLHRSQFGKPPGLAGGPRWKGQRPASLISWVTSKGS